MKFPAATEIVAFHFFYNSFTYFMRVQDILEERYTMIVNENKQLNYI